MASASVTRAACRRRENRSRPKPSAPSSSKGAPPSGSAVTSVCDDSQRSGTTLRRVLVEPALEAADDPQRAHERRSEAVVEDVDAV